MGQTHQWPNTDERFQSFRYRKAGSVRQYRPYWHLGSAPKLESWAGL